MTVPAFMRAAAIRPLRRLIVALPPNERGARSMLRQIGHGASVDADRFSREFIDWYLSLQRDTSTVTNDLAMIGTLVSVNGSMHSSLAMSTDLLRDVDVPTLFYWGADDPFGGPDVARTLVDTMRDASVDTAAGAGHLPWLDDPARAARAIDDFFHALTVGTTHV